MVSRIEADGKFDRPDEKVMWKKRKKILWYRNQEIIFKIYRVTNTHFPNVHSSLPRYMTRGAGDDTKLHG